MGVKTVDTGKVAPVMKRVMEFQWKCDKPLCKSVAVTEKNVAPDGWKYHIIYGSEYSSWEAIWCKECDEAFERSLKKTKTAMRISAAKRKKERAINDAKRLLEENHYRVVAPDPSDVQTLE